MFILNVIEILSPIIIISCRKSTTNNAIKIYTHKLLVFCPIPGVMLTHPLLLWVLRLDNRVGKPMLTLPNHLVLHVPRNMFQEDSLRSRVCILLFHSLQDLEPSFRVTTANATIDYHMPTPFFPC